MIRVLTERKKPLAEWQDSLTQIGGVDPRGRPRLLLFWGETLTRKLGFQNWSHPGPAGISVGSYDALVGLGVPAWHLARLEMPAEPAALWDQSIMGPYPGYGEYEIVQPFYRREIIGQGRFLRLHVMPMNSVTFRMVKIMATIIRDHSNDSLAKRKSALKEKQDRENKEEVDRLADLLANAVPEWRDAVSYNQRGAGRNLHSVMQQRMEQIERNQKRVLRFLDNRPRRTSVA